MNTHRFYIGTHASAEQPSIYACEVDFKRRFFTTLSTMQGLSDPTYLARTQGDLLYALGKSPDGGSVYALNHLSVLNTLPSGGKGPCHICLDERREFLLCANYGSGSVSLYDLNPDGSIHELCDHRQYSGVGFDSGDRQKGPHAHFAAFHNERSEVLVCDLGLDMVYVYELDREARKLRETDRSIRLPDGAGPRHLAFNDSHPGMLFVIAEMANSVYSYKFDPESRRYFLRQQISAVYDEETGSCPPDPKLMLPATADNGSIGCAIRFTKDGDFLFVSSRLGYQSISAFRCGADGELYFVSRCLCGGITPRDFHVFESEEEEVYLLVANQDSDLVTALLFDRGAEELSLLDMKMQAVKPTCILPI